MRCSFRLIQYLMDRFRRTRSNCSLQCTLRTNCITIQRSGVLEQREALEILTLETAPSCSNFEQQLNFLFGNFFLLEIPLELSDSDIQIIWKVGIIRVALLECTFKLNQSSNLSEPPNDSLATSAEHNLIIIECKPSAGRSEKEIKIESK